MPWKSAYSTSYVMEIVTISLSVTISKIFVVENNVHDLNIDVLNWPNSSANMPSESAFDS